MLKWCRMDSPLISCPIHSYCSPSVFQTWVRTENELNESVLYIFSLSPSVTLACCPACTRFSNTILCWYHGTVGVTGSNMGVKRIV